MQNHSITMKKECIIVNNYKMCPPSWMGMNWNINCVPDPQNDLHTKQAHNSSIINKSPSRWIGEMGAILGDK